jgi:hypothetical protein
MSRAARRHESIVESITDVIKSMWRRCEEDSDAMHVATWENGIRQRGERVVNEAIVADVIRVLLRDLGEEARLTITVHTGRFVTLSKVTTLLRDTSGGQPFVVRYGARANEAYRGCLHRADGHGFYSVYATLRFDEGGRDVEGGHEAVRIVVSRRDVMIYV